MAGRIESVRSDESRVLQAELTHIGVHALDEALVRAGDVFGEGDGSVVGGAKQKPIEEVDDPVSLSRPQVQATPSRSRGSG